jgi:phage terminase small subunit
MLLLRNHRHERFAQELAKGNSATEAYGLAGYRPHRQNAARLMTNDVIKERVAQLQQTAAQRTEITIERLIDEAEEARLLALANKQPNAMVAATMLKAKLAGVLVKRIEVGEPNEFENMTEQELREAIARLDTEISVNKTRHGNP